MPAGGSLTHSVDSPLFERRAGLGGPTALARRHAPPGATHPVTRHPHAIPLEEHANIHG